MLILIVVHVESHWFIYFKCAKIKDGLFFYFHLPDPGVYIARFAKMDKGFHIVGFTHCNQEKRVVGQIKCTSRNT